MSEEVAVPRTEWTPETIRIPDIVPLPNSDTLGVVNVFGAYPTIVKLGEFLPGDLAGYIPIESDVDTSRPEFAFLAKKARASGRYRIRAMKLRGTFSQGLLMPLPPGKWKEGDDIADAFGLEKYIPPSERERHLPSIKSMKKARRSETWPMEKEVWEACTYLAAIVGILAWLIGSWWTLLPIAAIYLGGYACVKRVRFIHKRPNIPYYDVTSILRSGNMFYEGEEVVLSEKLHGSQLSCVHTGRMFHLKSRTVFRGGPTDTDTSCFGFSFAEVWTTVAKKYDLENKLKSHPNMVVFGEIYGDKIQKGYLYGCGPEERGMAVFDVMDLDTRKFLDFDAYVQFCTSLDLPMVPVLYRGPYSEGLKELAEGQSTLDKSHPREGWVARPAIERYSDRVGRVQGKMIGQGYLLTKYGEDEE